MQIGHTNPTLMLGIKKFKKRETSLRSTNAKTKNIGLLTFHVSPSLKPLSCK